MNFSQPNIFARCKRLHPMLATAMKVLHFRGFMEKHPPLSDGLKFTFVRAQLTPTVGLLDDMEQNEEFKNLMSSYRGYMEETSSGGHGATAQYWIHYAELVDCFLEFNRACRTNDLNLYIFALSNLCPLFFACHRPNYSRWMVRFLHNLINIDATHPGVRTALEGGALSIRRTEKGFSRNAVNITLEQTVNADAASHSTGITAYTNSDSARKKWAITHSARSAVLSHLFKVTGLKSQEDTTKTLRPHRVKKDNKDLGRVIEGVKNTMNPFSIDADDGLYCLTTGARVKDNIRDDLVNCKSKGREWYVEFVTGCLVDPARFENQSR